MKDFIMDAAKKLIPLIEENKNTWRAQTILGDKLVDNTKDLFFLCYTVACHLPNDSVYEWIVKFLEACIIAEEPDSMCQIYSIIAHRLATHDEFGYEKSTSNPAVLALAQAFASLHRTCVMPDFMHIKRKIAAYKNSLLEFLDPENLSPEFFAVQAASTLSNFVGLSSMRRVLGDATAFASLAYHRRVCHDCAPEGEDARKAALAKYWDWFSGIVLKAIAGIDD
jgi:hypothetical protein